MRARWRAPGLIFVAFGWFSTGPAAGLVTALTPCHHEQMEHASGGQQHTHHTPPMPQGPCFCAYMAGGAPAIVPAVPAPTTESLLLVPPIAAVPPLVVRVVPGPQPQAPPDAPPPRSV